MGIPRCSTDADVWSPGVETWHSMMSCTAWCVASEDLSGRSWAVRHVGATHKSCISAQEAGYLAGVFTFPECLRLGAGLPDTTLAINLSQSLMEVKAQRVQDSSQSTYWWGIRRFERFATAFGIPIAKALQLAFSEPICPVILQYFLVWACDHMAFSTLQSTMAALSNWHKSKNCNTATTDKIVYEI